MDVEFYLSMFSFSLGVDLNWIGVPEIGFWFWCKSRKPGDTYSVGIFGLWLLWFLFILFSILGYLFLLGSVQNKSFYWLISSWASSITFGEAEWCPKLCLANPYFNMNGFLTVSVTAGIVILLSFGMIFDWRYCSNYKQKIKMIKHWNNLHLLLNLFCSRPTAYCLFSRMGSDSSSTPSSQQKILSSSFSWLHYKVSLTMAAQILLIRCNNLLHLVSSLMCICTLNITGSSISSPLFPISEEHIRLHQMSRFQDREWNRFDCFDLCDPRAISQLFAFWHLLSILRCILCHHESLLYDFEWVSPGRNRFAEQTWSHVLAQYFCNSIKWRSVFLQQMNHRHYHSRPTSIFVLMATSSCRPTHSLCPKQFDYFLDDIDIHFQQQAKSYCSYSQHFFQTILRFSLDYDFPKLRRYFLDQWANHGATQWPLSLESSASKTSNVEVLWSRWRINIFVLSETKWPMYRCSISRWSSFPDIYSLCYSVDVNLDCFGSSNPDRSWSLLVDMKVWGQGEILPPILRHYFFWHIDMLGACCLLFLVEFDLMLYPLFSQNPTTKKDCRYEHLSVLHGIQQTHYTSSMNSWAYSPSFDIWCIQTQVCKVRLSNLSKARRQPYTIEKIFSLSMDCSPGKWGILFRTLCVYHLLFSCTFSSILSRLRFYSDHHLYQRPGPPIPQTGSIQFDFDIADMSSGSTGTTTVYSSSLKLGGMSLSKLLLLALVHFPSLSLSWSSSCMIDFLASICSESYLYPPTLCTYRAGSSSIWTPLIWSFIQGSFPQSQYDWLVSSHVSHGSWFLEIHLCEIRFLDHIVYCMFWKSSLRIQTDEKQPDRITTSFWEFRIYICEFWNVLMMATVNERKCLCLLVRIAFWRRVGPSTSGCSISILFSNSLFSCFLFQVSSGLLADWHASIPSNIGDCSIWDLLCLWNCGKEVLICSHKTPRKARSPGRSWKQARHCILETLIVVAVSPGRWRLLKSWLVRSSGSWITCSASCFQGCHTRLLGCESTSGSPDRLFCGFSLLCMAAGMSRAWLAPSGPEILVAGRAFLPPVGSSETGNRLSLRCLCVSEVV